MPTVAEIERLAALVGRLTPLSSKQRGELIEAGDWNVVVGALMEVARATLAAGERELIPRHEHTDQVGIGWLDPRVRQLVTGGGLRDPAVETEFGKVRRDLTQLRSRLDRVNDDVEASRTRLSEVATNDLIRSAAMTRLDRKVLGAADDRGDIADLRTTLRTLETEVGRAVEVGGRLEIDGEPIDIPGLVDRLRNVEQLRDRLTQPDGELLDATSLERRLLELRTSLVTQEDLTEAIADVRTDVPGGAGNFDELLDAARAAGRETAGSSVEALGGELRSELARRFGDLEPTVTSAVDRATASLVDGILATTRSELRDAVGSLDETVRADLTARIDERVGTAVGELDERLAAIPDIVDERVTRAVDTQVSTALGDVDGRLDELGTAVAGLRTSHEDSTALLADLGTRVDAARREDAAARAQLRVELAERITGVENQLGPRIATAVDEARSILRTDLEATVAATRRDLEGRLAQVAREAAATEVQVLSTSIRTDVQSIVRQEVDANLAAVRNQFSTEIAGLQQRVAGMVANEVARATAEIPRIVDRELETLRPELHRIIDTRVNRPPIR